MPIDLNNMGVFYTQRDAYLKADDNAIINHNVIGWEKIDKLEQGGTLGNAIVRVAKRSVFEKEDNNKVRTDLLNALCKTFNVTGTGKERMDKLEKMLGKEFKRSDFGDVGDDLAATSGKPLTARRIKAIMNAADAEVKRQTMDEICGKVTNMFDKLELKDNYDVSFLKMHRDYYCVDKFVKPLVEFMGQEHDFPVADEISEATGKPKVHTLTSKLMDPERSKGCETTIADELKRCLFKLPKNASFAEFNKAIDKTVDLIASSVWRPHNIDQKMMLDKDGRLCKGYAYVQRLVKEELTKCIADFNLKIPRAAIMFAMD